MNRSAQPLHGGSPTKAGESSIPSQACSATLQQWVRGSQLGFMILAKLTYNPGK